MSAEARFVPLSSRRFVTIDLPPTIAERVTQGGNAYWANIDEPSDLVGSIVRICYTATREQAARIDNAQISRALLDAGAHRVQVLPTILPDQRARVRVDEHADVGDAVGLYLAALDVDDGVKRAMREQHEKYAQEVGT